MNSNDLERKVSSNSKGSDESVDVILKHTSCDFGIYGSNISEQIQVSTKCVLTDLIKEIIINSSTIGPIFKILALNTRKEESNKMLKLFLQSCSFLVPVNRIRTDYDFEIEEFFKSHSELEDLPFTSCLKGMNKWKSFFESDPHPSSKLATDDDNEKPDDDDDDHDNQALFCSFVANEQMFISFNKLNRWFKDYMNFQSSNETFSVLMVLPYSQKLFVSPAHFLSTVIRVAVSNTDEESIVKFNYPFNFILNRGHIHISVTEQYGKLSTIKGFRKDNFESLKNIENTMNIANRLKTYIERCLLSCPQLSQSSQPKRRRNNNNVSNSASNNSETTSISNINFDEDEFLKSSVTKYTFNSTPDNILNYGVKINGKYSKLNEFPFKTLENLKHEIKLTIKNYEDVVVDFLISFLISNNKTDNDIYLNSSSVSSAGKRSKDPINPQWETETFNYLNTPQCLVVSCFCPGTFTVGQKSFLRFSTQMIISPNFSYSGEIINQQQSNIEKSKQDDESFFNKDFQDE